MKIARGPSRKLTRSLLSWLDNEKMVFWLKSSSTACLYWTAVMENIINDSPDIRGSPKVAQLLNFLGRSKLMSANIFYPAWCLCKCLRQPTSAVKRRFSQISKTGACSTLQTTRFDWQVILIASSLDSSWTTARFLRTPIQVLLIQGTRYLARLFLWSICLDACLSLLFSKCTLYTAQDHLPINEGLGYAGSDLILVQTCDSSVCTISC